MPDSFANDTSGETPIAITTAFALTFLPDDNTTLSFSKLETLSPTTKLTPLS